MNQKNEKIISFDNTELFLNIVDFNSNDWIFVVHGVGEHSKRHNYLLELIGQRYNYCFMDLRGHGESKGRRAYVSDFSNYQKDLEKVIEFIFSQYKVEKINLHGHSMGALIVADYLSQNNLRFIPEKVLLSSPPIGINNFLGKKLKKHKIVTSFLSGIPVGVPLRGTIDLRKLSHDIRIYEDYITDKLNSLGIHSKLLISIVDSGNQVFSYPLPFDGKIAYVVGSEDIIVDVDEFKKYLANFAPNAEKLIVEGGYHELHNEIPEFQKPYFEFLREFYLTNHSEF